MTSRQRPTGVTLIGAYYFLSAVLNFLGAIFILQASDMAAGLGQLFGTNAVTNVAITSAILLLILALASAVLGWKLWDFKEWARIIIVGVEAMGGVISLLLGIALVVGFTIAGQPISSPGSGFANIIWALVHFAIVYYLTRPEVINLFSTGRTRIGTIAPPRHVTVAPPPPPVSVPPVAPPPPQPTRAAAPLPAGGGYGGAPQLEATKLAEQPRQSRAWLVDVGNGSRRFDLEPVTVLGRDGTRCQVVVNDPRVSKEHANIRLEHGQYVLRDLASSNGTYWNGRRVGQPVPLADGDRVRVGQSEMIFKEIR